MPKTALLWGGAAVAAVLMAGTVFLSLATENPVFENAIGAGQMQGGMSKSSWFYRGSVIASDPSVLKTKAGYVMFYTDLDAAKSRTVIARAVSADGVNWETEAGTGPVRGLVMSGRSGEWDENVESAAVVQTAKDTMLFFAGYKDEGNPFRGFPAALWAARSTDGQRFERVSSAPVMEPTKGWYDNDAIYSPTILYEDGVYHMIYVGHSYTDFSKISGGGVYLLSAKSTDGVNWTKSETPIARPGQLDGWRAEGVAEPYLIKAKAGSYILFYTGLAGEERSIGVATSASPDGPWDFGLEPLIVPGPKGASDEHQVLAPAAVLSGDELKVWYLAANKKEMLSIGHLNGTLKDALSVTGH